MTIEEANKLLETAPADDQPSRVNRNLTRRTVVDIIRRGLGPRACEADGTTLLPLYEKRVHQAVKDRSRPNY